MAVSEHEIWAEIDALSASQIFMKATRQRELLRYFAVHSFGDKKEVVKEWEIGVDLFGRIPGYDTDNDPIVRVNARHLRDRLEKYSRPKGAKTALSSAFPGVAFVCMRAITRMHGQCC